MMNKKMILTSAFLIVLISGAFGVAIGTIITQTQFDGLDFSNRSLEYSVQGKQKSDDFIIVTVDYKTLEKQSSGDWEVVLNTIEFSFPLEKYAECRSNGDSTVFCKEKAIDYIKTRAKDFRTKIRNNLESHKTKDFSSEIGIDDIVITSEELNNE